MLKGLLLILTLLSLSNSALFRIKDSDLELKTDAGTKGLQVTLTYIQGAGYVVPVHFTRNFLQPRNMIVTLYNSNVLLTQNCFQFNQYYCNQYAWCNRDTSRTYNTNYPWFSAQGNLAQTEVVLDLANWSLARNGPTLIATSCSTGMTSSYGAGTFGHIGFGFNGNARNNFHSQVSSFSTYYSFGAFRLEFNPNINFRRNLIANVRTDQNWVIPNIESIAIGNSVNRLTGVNAIWDINSDAIGLPLALFNTFVPALQTYGIFCQNGVFYQPICTFNQALPNLFINPDGFTSITIIPQIYALNIQGNQFKLNIRALSPNMNGLNYVQQDYQYTIILGNTVLGNYYHHFQLNANTVSIYQAL